MSAKGAIAIASLILVSACTVGAKLPPPAPDHPASPEAAAAPVPPRMSALDADSAVMLEDEGAGAMPSHGGHDHGEAMEHGQPADEGHSMEHDHSMDSMK